MTKIKYFNMTQLEKEPFVRSEGINLVESRYKMYLIIIFFPCGFHINNITIDKD